jgi:hypothetical protein
MALWCITVASPSSVEGRRTGEQAINGTTGSSPERGETALSLVDTALALLVRHWDELSEQRRREIVTAAAERMHGLRRDLLPDDARG